MYRKNSIKFDLDLELAYNNQLSTKIYFYDLKYNLIDYYE